MVKLSASRQKPLSLSCQKQQPWPCQAGRLMSRVIYAILALKLFLQALPAKMMLGVPWLMSFLLLPDCSISLSWIRCGPPRPKQDSVLAPNRFCVWMMKSKMTLRPIWKPPCLISLKPIYRNAILLCCQITQKGASQPR